MKLFEMSQEELRISCKNNNYADVIEMVKCELINLKDRRKDRIARPNRMSIFRQDLLI